MRIPIATLLGLTLLAGCASGPGVTPPPPTFPVPAELLPTAVPGSPGAELTCGGQVFPASGLDAPTGAEKAVGPEYDALRATLTSLQTDFPGSAGWTWRVAGRSSSGVVFLAQPAVPDQPEWMEVELTPAGAGWLPGAMGQCNLAVVLSPQYGPATWALDPAFSALDATTTQLHVLVWESACSSGSPTTGRMSAPVIVADSSSVTITIGVHPLTGPQTCPLGPGTPAIVQLPEQLGARTLLDGGHVPPAPPTSPAG